MSPRTPRRSRRPPEAEPHRERWLVSYADFITLMFAFFVVMYATSTMNEGKYRVLSDSLFSAFRHERALPQVERIMIAPVMPPLPVFRTLGRPARTPAPVALPLPQQQQQQQQVQQQQRLQGLAVKISDALRSLVQSGQVRLAQTPNGLAVEINASVLFAPAQAVLQSESIVALKAVAEVLSDVDNPIEVEGHTDNVPIATPQYPSNWELASARASAVVRLFIESGMAPEQLVAAGHAANRPVDSNETPEGRARNRRVTVLIRSETATRAERAIVVPDP